MIKNQQFSEMELFGFYHSEDFSSGTYTLEVTMSWQNVDVREYTVRVIASDKVEITGDCGKSGSCPMLNGDQGAEGNGSDEPTDDGSSTNGGGDNSNNNDNNNSNNNGGTDDWGTDDWGTDTWGSDDWGTDDWGTDNWGSDDWGSDDWWNDDGGSDNGGSDNGNSNSDDWWNSDDWSNWKKKSKLSQLRATTLAHHQNHSAKY